MIDSPTTDRTPYTSIMKASLTAVCLAGTALVTMAFAQERETDIPEAPFETFEEMRLSDLARETGYAEVNGLNIYYEIHGEGAPLVVIHGGFMNIDAIGPLIPALAEHRQIIAVELQGHGRTADIDRPISYEAMADDIAALIDHLGLERADVFGFSLGGGVALQAAIRHPQRVHRLIVVSAPFRGDGWSPEVRASMTAVNADEMLDTIMYREYQRLAPDPDHWPIFVNKMRAFVGKNQDYDWSEGISRFEGPALVVIADTDFVSPEHAAELARLLGGDAVNGGMGPSPETQLAVLPGATHFDILYRIELLLPAVTAFLDGAGAARAR